MTQADWLRQLPASAEVELDTALERVRGREVSTLTAGDFKLASLSGAAEAWKQELLSGRGFVVIRGLPIERYSEQEATALYWGIGCLLGTPIAQKARGDVLYSVRDEGYNIQKDYGTVGVRFSKTTEALNFHTDSALEVRGKIPDVVGLLAWQVARAGGDSALVSARAAYQVISAERPDYLERLCRPFAVDRRVELLPDESAVLYAPVFEKNAGVWVRYFRYYIERSPEMTGQPLTDFDVEALDFLDQVCQRPEMQIRFAMQRGDMQFVNNRFILHSRTRYDDWPEPERKRHFVRLWLEC